MKTFELPVIEVVLFTAEDVITTSYIPDDDQTPGV